MKHRLKELRKAQKPTPGDLVKVLSVTKQTINAIEDDKYNPNLKLAR